MKKKITKKYIESDLKEYKNLPANEKPILFVRNLTKKYFGKKKPAIDGINFSVHPGQFHAFIGANGAGKTTTIKSLIGAYSKWKGTVLICGIKNNKKEAKKKIGYIPETARFPEQFSALEYLEWMVMLSGIKRKEAKKYAINKLKELNMYSLRRKSPNSFSSGQKKKILLAQALIHNPEIIIMDEPVANLDPKARIEFFDTLLELKRKGKAIFISSHVLAELDIYSDSITVLDGGKVVYSGDKVRLLRRYSTKKHMCICEKSEQTKKYLDKNKIKYDFVEQTKEFTIFFDNIKQKDRFQKNMVVNKNYIVQFNEIYPTLDDIYKKLIIKGSVDTMDANNNAPKKTKTKKKKNTKSKTEKKLVKKTTKKKTSKKKK